MYVLLGMFLLQGLALMHAARESFGLGGWVVFVFYVLLFVLSALVLPVLVLSRVVRLEALQPAAPAGDDRVV